MRCLLLTSNDLPQLPSEAQELVNLLGQNDYKVHLLQSNVNSLELYRTLDGHQYDLVWVAGHSGSDGFAFGSNIITPTELGQFLVEAGAVDLVLNSCYSSEHVRVIQGICDLNILATIIPEITDKLAWTNAIYLARALVRKGSIQLAYTEVSSSDRSSYRFFPARKLKQRNNPVDGDRLARIERQLEQNSRILRGDANLHVPGILENIDVLRKLIHSSLDARAKWERDTEERIRSIEEDNKATDYITMDRQTVRILAICFVLSTGFIILFIFLLRNS